MAEKRIKALNEQQDRLVKRLKEVEARIIVLEERRFGRGLKTPLLTDADMALNIEMAAWELEDSIFDGVLPKTDEGTTLYPEKIEEARAHHVELVNASNAYSWAVLGLVILTFMEVPAWCHGLNPEQNLWTFHPGHEWCPLPSPPHGNRNPNLSGISYLPPGYAFIIELLIECVIMYKFCTGWSFERNHLKPLDSKIGKDDDGSLFYEQLKRSTNHIGVVLAIGSILDTGFFIMFRMPFRCTFIFRTGLIFLLPSVQHPFWNIFSRKVMAEFMSVAVFFVATVCFFAWIGVTVLGKADKLAYIEGGEKRVDANEGMENMQQAIITMFVGGVTGEFIDCFLPSFSAYRLTGALWMIYLLLTQVLFKNLVMDTLISAYLKGYNEEEKNDIEGRVSAMTAAFRRLSRDGETISREDYLALVAVLAKSPRWKPIPPRTAEMMYDECGEEGVTEENWCDIVSMIQNEFWVTPLSSVLKLQDKNSAEAKWLCDSVWGTEEGELPLFDWIMNYVLFFNLGLVVIESFYDYNSWDEPAFMDYIDIAFSFVYLGEVCVKLAVKSFGEYWSDGGNRFDFFTTWLLLSTSLVKYLPFDAVKTDLSHYANILRLLRLIRILKQLKSYSQVQFMIKTVTRIINEANEVLALMGTFFFFFCTLAVNLFGGLLYEGNDALEGSEYAEKHWYILNFNDMFMAFMTWFVQILCEYVPNYADALRRTATAAGLFYGPWAGSIVFFFYITTAAIMYELLLAFTVEVFMAVKKEEGQEQADEEVAECKAEEKEEKEKLEELRENKSSSSSSSSSSCEEFDMEAWFEGLKASCNKKSLDLYHSSSLEKAVIDEFKEAWMEKIEAEENISGVETDVDMNTKIMKAVWIFENSIYDQVQGPADKLHSVTIGELYPKDLKKAREDHLRALEAANLYYRMIFFLIILTLIEVPAWCHQSKADHLTMWSLAPGIEWCQAPLGGKLHLSGIWYLPPVLGFVAEIVIESTIFYKFWLEKNIEQNHFRPLTLPGNPQKGQIKYFGAKTYLCGLVFSVGSIIDTALFMLFHDNGYTVRCTFIFRTGLLCLLPNFQRLWNRIFNWQMMGQFFSVAVFFIGTVLFFAWIAVTIYKTNDSVAFYQEEKAIYANKGFETLGGAIYTMFLAGMTEGFSDIFIPTVTENRIAAVLWLCFLMLTQILFLNLVIDSFVFAYLKGSEKHLNVTASTQAKACLYVVQLLFNGEETMPEDTFMKFLAEVGKSARMRNLSPEVAKLIYDRFEEMNKENFGDVWTLVQEDIWVAPQDSIVKTLAPNFWESPIMKRTRDFVMISEGEEGEEKPEGEELLQGEEKAEGEPEEDAKSEIDVVMEWVLFFNMIYVVYQSLAGDKDDPGVAPKIPGWIPLAMFFTLVYVVEVFVKLSVKSWKTYWSAFDNKFDFFTTWLLFATSMLKYLPIAALQQDLARYANVLRLLRLVRVVKNFKKYKSVQFMVRTTVKMIALAGDILLLLLVVLFFFTTTSVNFFGGLLYEGNPKLEGSDYEDKQWWVFNFNDIIMAFVTWFTQLLCEYAPEWADALYRTSPIGYIAWYIFPLFYIIGVAVVFEILKAFTIETYLALKEEEDGDEEEEESDSDSDEEEAFDTKVIKAVTERLKKEDQSLHYKETLLKKRRKKIKETYDEMREKRSKGKAEAKEENGEEKA